MTEAELQEQLDSLAKSKAEADEFAAKAAKENEELRKQLSSADERIKSAIPKDYADLQKAVKEFDPIRKENEQLKNQLVLSELASKYRDVDFTLIPPGTREQMESHAAKLQAMIDKKVQAVIPKDKPTGDRWNAVPPLGGVDLDSQAQKAVEAKAKADVDAAVKSGNPASALDACLAAQPRATQALLATLQG